jgi:outer membrane receptor for ferrienterochelin and colicins
MNKKLISAFLLSTAISCISSNLSYAAEDAISDASMVTYDKAYFVTFSPVTLLDMLQAVPGVPEILTKNRQQSRRNSFGGGQRGFGSGGDQILMDGKRLAGKANNIDDTLSRVSASQIDRIELIRGAASGLDVQSEGLVINIVMLEGISTSTTFWKVTGEYSGGHNFVPEFLLSHSGSKGNLDYTFSGERKDNDFFYNAHETFFDAAGTQTAIQDIAGDFGRDGYKFNTNLAYAFNDGSRLRINGLYEPSGNDGQEVRSKTTNTIDPITYITDRDMGKWEVGGDYSRDLGVLGNLKTLFVINRNTEDGDVNRFKGSGAAQFDYVRDVTTVNRTEKIFRASITKGIAEGQSLELGGEAAINTFDKSFINNKRQNALDNSITAVATDPFVIGNNDNVEIKENRYEIFANHSFNISSKMVLQSSLTTEFSKIIADNIFVNASSTRRDTSFTYLKPRINFRYDFTGRDQFRIIAEKKVSQLNFNNFVTRFDQQEQIFKFGNTNIRPEQTWDFSFAFEHRLPNDSGSLEAEVFYRKYTDHISVVDFTEYYDAGLNLTDVNTFFGLNPDQTLIDYVDDQGTGFTAKSGNIDSAKAYGVKLKSSLRLGFIGVPQATLSLGYTYEKRTTTDQFTLLERTFDRHSDHRATFNFRHDITQYQLTYGFEGDVRSDQVRSYINSYWPSSPAANIKVFLEKTVFTDYKIRFEGEGLTKNRGASTYNLYNDHIRLNDLREVQEKLFRRPVELRISIQGTF